MGLVKLKSLFHLFVFEPGNRHSDSVLNVEICTVQRQNELLKLHRSPARGLQTYLYLLYFRNLVISKSAKTDPKLTTLAINVA